MKKYKSIEDRVARYEEKHAIKYATTNGALYKTLKIIYLILAVYTLFINSFFLIGMSFNLKNASGTVDSAKANGMILVGICTGAVILGYVLICTRLKLVGGIVSIIPAGILIPVFARMMEDTLGWMGYKISFYWRHLVPLALMLILVIAFTAISERARIKSDRAYKRILENLYLTYQVDAQNITDEQWDEFLENYTPNTYKNQFPEQNDNKREDK